MHRRAPQADGVELEQLVVDELECGGDTHKGPDDPGEADGKCRAAPRRRGLEDRHDRKEHQAQHGHRHPVDVVVDAGGHLQAVDDAAGGGAAQRLRARVVLVGQVCGHAQAEPAQR